MADAAGSDISEDYSDDVDSGGYYSSDNDEADMGLIDAAPGSKERPPYRIIDADMLNKVQVRRSRLSSSLRSKAGQGMCPTCSLELVFCMKHLSCSLQVAGHAMAADSKCYLQAEAIQEVESIWACRKSVAKTLLMHYMWDKEKLLSEWR